MAGAGTMKTVTVNRRGKRKRVRVRMTADEAED